jgi:hypothetical protein
LPPHQEIPSVASDDPPDLIELLAGDHPADLEVSTFSGQSGHPAAAYFGTLSGLHEVGVISHVVEDEKHVGRGNFALPATLDDLSLSVQDLADGRVVPVLHVQRLFLLIAKLVQSVT